MSVAVTLIDAEFLGHCEYCKKITNSRDADGDWACANGTGCARPINEAQRQAARNLLRGRVVGKTNADHVTFMGESKTIGQWAAHYGISKNALELHRRSHRWTMEQELEYREANVHSEVRPTGAAGRRERLVVVDGVEKTLSEWAVVLNSTSDSLRVSARRRAHGLDDEIRFRLAKKAKRESVHAREAIRHEAL